MEWSPPMIIGSVPCDRMWATPLVIWSWLLVMLAGQKMSPTSHMASVSPRSIPCS